MKKRMFKTAVRLILAVAILITMLPIGTLPAKAEAQAQASLPSIEEQIRAYADSIDQNDAVSTAARVLALHGMTMGGKTLTMDENDALTAVLMNSELLQNALIDGCTAAIEHIEIFHLSEIPFTFGGCNWYEGDSSYSLHIYRHGVYENATPELTLVAVSPYTGATNDYDLSLKWMVAGTNLSVQAERIRTTSDCSVYKVTATISDRFDFATSSNNGFKDLISGIGTIMFREFDWETSVSFELTVSNTCTHTVDNYHWTYDAEQKKLISDTSGSFTENHAQRLALEHETGTRYYHKLEREVVLRHDQAWVLEYSVKNPNKFCFSPVVTKDTTQPYLLNYHRDYLFFACKSMEASESAYYGTALDAYFAYNTEDTYTFCLENVIAADGSNKIYLTVYNEDLQTVVLETTPMDDCYVIENESFVRKETESNALSGMDFVFKYIGNQSYRFDPDAFRLTIWPKGQDVSDQSCYQSMVVPPSCTEDGYTAHTCSACGYSYNTDYVPAYGHSFGDWYVETASTCVQHGSEARDCVTCKTHETRVLPTTDHVYVPTVTAPTCIEQGYTTHTCVCGDSYIDSYADATGHNWALIEQVDPTCTLDGYAIYTCHCGEKMKEILPSTGHGDRETRGAVKATCMEDGYSGDIHCVDCGRKITTGRVLPATGHSYVDGICKHCGISENGAGDVNGDGTINYLDAMLIARYYVGDISDEDLNLNVADVSSDGKVDYLDAMLVARLYVGDIETLP